MLKASYLADCAGAYSQLYAQLEADICADIARRYAKYGGKMTESSRWQIQKLREAQAAYSAYADMVSRTDRKAAKVLRSTIVDGCAEALKIDDKIYRMAGKAPVDIASSLALQEVIMAGIRKTEGLMQNLTMTTANTASGAFERGLDRAYMQVISGTYDPITALRRLINDLGDKGYQSIVYPSQHKDHLDVAARRALLTGLNQTTAEVQLARAREMDSDLVEVSSHGGARPSHQVWQGQIYSLSGRNPKYGSFYNETGYGTGDGLCGWNCYHNFYPYFEGISMPTFTDTHASDIGKTDMQMYDESQEQRALERKVREARRECVTLNAAMEEADDDLRDLLAQDFGNASRKLKRREAELTRFCDKTDRTEYKDRLMVYGFNRSVSAKAVWANRKSSSLTLSTKYGKITIDERAPEKFSLSNVAARKWYIEHDARIPKLVDRSLPLEDQARQACELRNIFRTMTRDLMKDQEVRKQLDRDEPNKTFEWLLKHKINDKHMTREEAIQDILETATKTNAKVNEDLGLGGGNK